MSNTTEHWNGCTCNCCMSNEEAALLLADEHLHNTLMDDGREYDFDYASDFHGKD